VRKSLAFVELHAVDDSAALAQYVLVHAGRLAGDVLEDEDAQAHNSGNT
jgi:hydrogenase maturation factor